MLLACIDGGLCVVLAAAAVTGASTLLVKLGKGKEHKCEPVEELSAIDKES